MSEVEVKVRRFSRSKREEDVEPPTPAPSPVPPEDSEAEILFGGDSTAESDLEEIDDGDEDDDDHDFLKDLKGGKIPVSTPPAPPKLKKEKKTVKFNPEPAVNIDIPMFHPAPESALMSEFGIEPNNYCPSPKPRQTKKTKNDSSFSEFGELFSNKDATPILGEK